jgi:acetolactate synthase regulatory subunit
MAGQTGELRPRTLRGFRLCRLAHLLPRTTLMSQFAASVADHHLPDIACFSVQARAEPGVMPRVLELFSKRGLVPSSWQSSTCGADRSRLTIDIEMRGLGHETVDYIAACLRQIVFIEIVSTARGPAPG